MGCCSSTYSTADSCNQGDYCDKCCTWVPNASVSPLNQDDELSAPAPPISGIFKTSVEEPTQMTTIVTTGNTPLPPTPFMAGYVHDPSVDSTGTVAFLACAKTDANVSGVYIRDPAPVEALRRIADTSMFTSTKPAPGRARFHQFFGVSLEGTQAAITANAWCGAKYECGIFLASDEGDSWGVEPIADVCQDAPQFAGVGQATLRGTTVAFVAQTPDGKEGIYRTDTANAKHGYNLTAVVQSGDKAPGAKGAFFTSFPQPPSVSNGELVFRAYISSGDTGIYHANRQGKVTKLVDTLDTLENGRKIVYMGSGESALGSDGAYSFYASTTDAKGKHAYDGVYLGYAEAGGSD